MHLVLVAVLIIGACVVASLLVLAIVRRTIPVEVLAPHNDVAGFVYASIAVTYAVILGLALISIWEQYQRADEQAVHEANAAANLYRLADGLPTATRVAVEAALVDYARAVINEEWPAMQRGERLGVTATESQASARFEDLWRLYQQANVDTGVQGTFVDKSIDELLSLSDLRRERLVVSNQGLLPVIWAALLFGGIMTVIFPCIFGVESGGVHAIVIACLAATLGLLLYLAFEMNHPFRGNVHVEPHGFVEFLRIHGLSPSEPATPVATPISG